LHFDDVGDFNKTRDEYSAAEKGGRRRIDTARAFVWW
jgi:hypothetical protein